MTRALIVEAHAQRDALSAAREQVAQAEAQLELRQAFTEALLDTVDVGIVSCDAAGQHIEGNQAQHELLRVPDGAHGVEFRTEDGQLLAAEDYPLLRTLRGEGVHNLGLQIGPAGGPQHDVLINGRQMCAPDGTVIGAVVATTDVSVARQSTRELAEKGRWLAEAKRIGRLGSFSYDVASGRYTISAQLRTLWGLPAEGCFEEQTRAAMHPADRAAAAQAFAAALATGGRHAWTHRIHRRTDGALRYLSNVVEVIQDDAGRPVNVRGTHQDVTELVEAEQRAVHANTLLEAILSATPDYTYVSELATGAVTYASPGKSMLGVTSEALMTLGADAVTALIHPDDQQPLRAVNVDAADLADGQVLQVRYRGRHANGTWHWLSRRITPFRRDAATGAVLEVLSVLRDVTDVVQAEDQLIYTALHDPLTGLPNRALLMDRLEAALARAQQSHRDVAVLFCDLDGFKRVNDTAGHAAGDTVLTVAAARLRDVLRPHDTIARVGGDEFVIIIEPWDRDDAVAAASVSATGDCELAIALAGRIAAALREPILVEGIEHVVSASIGITYSGRGNGTERGGLAGPISADEVLQDADAAMYQAKHRGKDRFEIFEHSLRVDLVERGRVEQVLRRALRACLPVDAARPAPPPRTCAGTTANAQLSAVYQPVFDLDSGTLVGFEALARLSDEYGEQIPPDVFIGIAETTGLIRTVGLHMLDDACAQLAAWQGGRSSVRALTMAVNISALQASHSFLGDDVRQSLRRHHLDPHDLVLEVTETALLQAGPSALAELRQLREDGVGIAIDDFGTGYASLRYLATLPVTIVKVDKTFTAGLPRDPTSSKIVRAVAGLAADMNLECIVEGVETAEQQHCLPAGVRVQGFLTGRPAAPAQLELTQLALPSG